MFFLLSGVQKASLVKGRKSLGEQTFTQKRLISIRKKLFAGRSGRTGLQNHEQSGGLNTHSPSCEVDESLVRVLENSL